MVVEVDLSFFVGEGSWEMITDSELGLALPTGTSKTLLAS